MKRINLLFPLFVFVFVFSLTSCKEDKYLDWKYLNEQWLSSNYDPEDNSWKMTESGLQYKVIYEGVGPYIVGDKSLVTFVREGKYIDGSVFQQRAVVYSYLSDTSTIPEGLKEGLKMMRQDAIYEFRVPYGIGYGKDGAGAIPPYSTLLYRIELLRSITGD